MKLIFRLKNNNVRLDGIVYNGCNNYEKRKHRFSCLFDMKMRCFRFFSLLNKWSDILPNEKGKDFEITLINIADLLIGKIVEGAEHERNLIYKNLGDAIEFGRKYNKLVVIQYSDISQFKALENQRLSALLLGNTQDLEELDYEKLQMVE